jgi:hypothetical protein
MKRDRREKRRDEKGRDWKKAEERELGKELMNGGITGQCR